MHPKPAHQRSSPELPASALYSTPALGRLWKKVHLACSPFLRRPAVRRLYQKPAAILRQKLTGPYSLIALGCADGIKESHLLKKLPLPAFLLAADTNLTLARRATRRLPARHKRSFKIDLLKPLPAFHLPPFSIKLLTLFGVLPNLDPLPLLQRIAQRMKPGDLLLFSANLAPGKSAFPGARKVLFQSDNVPTRKWLEKAVQEYRPRLSKGRLSFGVFPDPKQRTLARIEARWISPKTTVVVFASRRPTVPQVEAWLRLVRLKRLARLLDPCGEEGVWLVAR